MTVDEIKEKYSMREVVESYGIKINRTGFCCCPFHKEKTPSMKIYDKSFNCFGCGANGDVFTFVQRIENYTFKEAFYQLGGEYERLPQRQRETNKLNREIKKEEQKRARENEEKSKKYIANTITIMQVLIEKEEPLSDLWCLAQNYKPQTLNDWDELFVQEIEEERGERLKYAVRRCRKFRREFDSFRGTI